MMTKLPIPALMRTYKNFAPIDMTQEKRTPSRPSVSYGLLLLLLGNAPLRLAPIGHGSLFFDDYPEGSFAMAKICTYSFDEYLHLVESFHGSVAPGLVIGGFMVDLAVSRIPEGIVFDAISETKTCLPDAIQLLTPCTTGNNWLKVLDFGRYALSVYDKSNGKGARVFIDPAKLEPWPEIKAWFLKLKPKAEQKFELLISQIEQAGQALCGIQTVMVRPEYLEKKKVGPVVACAQCHEFYPAKDGALCRACQGGSPYLDRNCAKSAGS